LFFIQADLNTQSFSISQQPIYYLSPLRKSNENNVSITKMETPDTLNTSFVGSSISVYIFPPVSFVDERRNLFRPLNVASIKKIL
jgi:hypothetical protein